MNTTVVLGGQTNLITKIDGTISLSNVIDGQTMEYLGGMVQLEDNVEITPSAEEQVVEPSTGYVGLKSVTVNAIPTNYGLITWSGLGIRVS